MAASIGLTLYNLGQRRDLATPSVRPPRPVGRLIWLHAPGEGLVSPMRALARRIVEEDGLPVLLTAPTPGPDLEGVVMQPPAPDNPVDARSFLDHWHPEIAVFAGGQLRPAVMHEAADRQIPMLVVNGKAPAFLRERDGWYPGLMRSALARLRVILAEYPAYGPRAGALGEESLVADAAMTIDLAYRQYGAQVFKWHNRFKHRETKQKDYVFTTKVDQRFFQYKRHPKYRQ